VTSAEPRYVVTSRRRTNASAAACRAGFTLGRPRRESLIRASVARRHRPGDTGDGDRDAGERVRARGQAIPAVDIDRDEDRLHERRGGATTCLTAAGLNCSVDLMVAARDRTHDRWPSTHARTARCDGVPGVAPVDFAAGRRSIEHGASRVVEIEEPAVGAADRRLAFYPDRRPVYRPSRRRPCPHQPSALNRIPRGAGSSGTRTRANRSPNMRAPRMLSGSPALAQLEDASFVLQLHAHPPLAHRGPGHSETRHHVGAAPSSGKTASGAATLMRRYRHWWRAASHRRTGARS
jgi:hypothetical protein